MRIFATLIVFLLAGCAQPVAQLPQLDTARVEEESVTQYKYAEEKPEKIFSTFKPAEMRKRFNRVQPRVAEAGFDLCMDMKNIPSECHFWFQFSTKREVNAWADGDTIYVTGSMAGLAANDEELAMVMAHEFAHNMMRHPQGAASNAAIGGLIGSALDALSAAEGYGSDGEFRDIGAEVGRVSYSPSFEREADYIGLYIVARAGYDPAKAVHFWRRMSAYDPEGLKGSYTHPSNSERMVAMERTIAEIQQKQADGGKLIPFTKPNR